MFTLMKNVPQTIQTAYQQIKQQQKHNLPTTPKNKQPLLYLQNTQSIQQTKNHKKQPS